MIEPLGDPVQEAQRLLAMARAEGLTVRLLGGVAVAIRSASQLPAALRRSYKDLDFVTVKSDAARFNSLLVGAGYEADERFNTIHGAQRLLHYDRANGKQLGTFVDAVAMCHQLDLRKRLPPDSDTLTPADLLLTKLQIVEVNDKDLSDAIALLLVHPIGQRGPGTVNLDELEPILRADWGWYTTITDNLAKVGARVHGVDLEPDARARVADRISELDAAIQAFPKTVKWTLRSKIGRRMPWYDLPEEV